MTLHKQICSVFCDGLSIREVPLGYAIRTPFSWINGEPLVIYGEKSDSLVRIRDGGDTLTLVEDIAGDLTTETKLNAIRDLAKQHDVFFDEENSLFLSDWTDAESVGEAAIKFMSFLNRMQDLAFLSRERVANAFREQLFEAIRERFGERYYVGKSQPLSNENKDNIVDILIRDARIQAAVYAATNEVNVLEALLTEQISKSDQSIKTVTIVVFEDLLSGKVKSKTRRRVVNSLGMEIADWQGGQSEVINKIGGIFN